MNDEILIPPNNLRTCPLCKSTLIKAENPQNEFNAVFYCPTKVNHAISNDFEYQTGAGVGSHYDIDGAGLVAYYTEEFQVIEIISLKSKYSGLDTKIFNIYRLNKQQTRWMQIATAEPFEVISEKQLINRIKTILVFS